MEGTFKILSVIGNEPIDLQEASTYLRVDYHDEDMLISRLITSARVYGESITRRAFVTQSIQHIYSIRRPIGGEVSGVLSKGPSLYQYQEQLGANPFGSAQFYFDLAMPPVQSTIQQITVETKITAFENWRSFPLIQNNDLTYNMYIDNNREPARIYFMSPITANFWRFTYTAGYDGTTYAVPRDLRQALLELVAYWFDHREGEEVPKGIREKFLARRADWF